EPCGGAGRGVIEPDRRLEIDQRQRQGRLCRAERRRRDAAGNSDDAAGVGERVEGRAEGLLALPHRLCEAGGEVGRREGCRHAQFSPRTTVKKSTLVDAVLAAVALRRASRARARASTAAAAASSRRSISASKVAASSAWRGLRPAT